jgi:hypothetical protein
MKIRLMKKMNRLLLIVKVVTRRQDMKHSIQSC